MTLKKPLLSHDINITILARIGMAIFPEDGERGAALLKKSDLLIHQAKKVNGHQYKMNSFYVDGFSVSRSCFFALGLVN